MSFKRKHPKLKILNFFHLHQKFCRKTINILGLGIALHNMTDGLCVFGIVESQKSVFTNLI
jgi:hypothetical protein